MASPVAVLDACVLYPAPLRDLLLTLAHAGLYRARWTEQIHAEWIENLLANDPHRERAKLERTRDMMNAAIRDCLIVGYEPLIETLVLPDPDDCHVLAAAMCGGAEAIVTFNLRDFPSRALSRYDVEARHPDEFVLELIEEQEAGVVAAVRAQRARLRKPPQTVDEFLTTLEAQRLTQTVKRLRAFTKHL